MKMIYEEISSPADASFLVRQYVQPELNTPFHFHHEYELLYIGNGYGKLYAGNKIANFTGGDIYLFGPGFAHCLYTDKAFVESKQMAHAIVVQFKQDFLGSGFFEIAELRKIKRLLSQSRSGIKIDGPAKQLPGLFRDIAKAEGLQSLLILLQLLDALTKIKRANVSYISTQQEDALINNGPGKIETVLKYIMEHFGKELSVKKASAMACMNEAAFCRYFKRRTRKTFSQFVNEVRITHATRLLLNSNNSIMNVCFECGFNNVSYFNRQFKDIIGKTPLAYRKEFVQEA